MVGYSTSYSHHQQSVRVGWRCMDNENIELLSYCYDNGKRVPEESLGFVKPDQKFLITLKNSKKFFTIILFTESIRKVVTVKKSSPGWCFKYLLFPYFGGNKKSPNTMKIFID